MSTSSTKILDIYEAIERASEEMLAAARASNWDEVIRLEGVCVQLITQLRQSARQAELNLDEQAVKHRMMQRILVNDAEIRHLADPLLRQLPDSAGDPPYTIH